MLGSLRLKVLILIVLVGLTFQMSWNVSGTEACQECVPLQGGLCVGCITTSSGHETCTPIQETCSCNVSGSCRTDGDQTEGGGGGS